MLEDYTFRVVHDEKRRVYVAICNEFFNLSAEGTTEAQALAEAQMALASRIEYYEQRGWQLPASAVKAVA